jgi:class 3 adenylate cyclase
VYKKSIELKRVYADEQSIALSYGNLGRLLSETGNYTEAVKYLSDDLQIIEKYKPTNLVLIAKLNFNIAKCYLDLGNLDKSEYYVKKCIDLISITKDDNLKLPSYFLLAEIYLFQKKAIKANEIVKDLSKLNIEKNSGLYFFGMNKFLAKYYYQEKKFHLSIKHYKLIEGDYEKSINLSLNEKIHFFWNYAKALKESSQIIESAKRYRQSLELADGSDNYKLRDKVEGELKSTFYDSWLLYSTGRFIGHRHSVELINTAGKNSFAGESKKVAVLFSDIRGFTNISEKKTANEIVLILNHLLKNITKILELHEGFIDKYMGDAVMAIFSLFSDGRETSKKLEKALEACLFIREEIKRLNDFEFKNECEIKMGVGLHYGECVAGLIGSPQKRSYTFRDNVNLASRLEGLTKHLGADIIVSRDFIKELKTPEKFLWLPLGKYRVKGRENPIELFCLVGLAHNAFFVGKRM